MRPPCIAFALIACLAALPASAQDLRPESLKLYGGTYSPDCGDTAAPRVRIGADAVEITRGEQTLRTRVTADSFASFGAAPTR